MKQPRGKLNAVLSIGLLFGATALLVVPELAEARGFARASPAMGGNFGARTGGEAVNLPVREQAGAGSAGGFGQPMGAGSAGGFGQPGAARRSDVIDRPIRENVSEAAVTGGIVNGTAPARELPRQPPRKTEPVSAAEMDSYRQQFKEQNRENRNWDDHIYQPIYDPSLDEKRKAIVVGAGAVAAERRREVADYALDNDTVYAVGDETEFSELPCDVQGELAGDDGVSYYRCKTAWYRRGLHNGEVVYIKTEAPPGY